MFNHTISFRVERQGEYDRDTSMATVNTEGEREDLGAEVDQIMESVFGVYSGDSEEEVG